MARGQQILSGVSSRELLMTPPTLATKWQMRAILQKVGIIVSAMLNSQTSHSLAIFILWAF